LNAKQPLGEYITGAMLSNALESVTTQLQTQLSTAQSEEYVMTTTQVQQLINALQSDLNTNLGNYATTTQLSTVETTLTTQLNTKQDKGDYLTPTSLLTQLTDYVTNTALQAFNYVTSTQLTTALTDYVTSASLTSALTDYVTNTSLTTQLSGLSGGSSPKYYYEASQSTSTTAAFGNANVPFDTVVTNTFGNLITKSANSQYVTNNTGKDQYWIVSYTILNSTTNAGSSASIMLSSQPSKRTYGLQFFTTAWTQASQGVLVKAGETVSINSYYQVMGGINSGSILTIVQV
jgi:hypothetical protein